MAALDRWQEGGAAALAGGYAARLSGGHRIAADGDLLAPERRSLAAALAAAPSWLDPATGAPALDWPGGRR